MDTITQTKTQVVEELYEAFGRGDVPFILSHLDQNVKWQVMGTAEIPYSGMYNGPLQVGTFFMKLNEIVEFSAFEAKEFFENKNVVLVTGRFDGKSRKTGKNAESIWCMRWEFSNGKVVAFNDYYNSAKVADTLK